MQTILIVIFLIIIIGIIAFLVYKGRQNRLSNKAKTVSAIVLAVTIICFAIVPVGFYQVETGEAAVLKTFGKAHETVNAGLHWRFWVKDTVVTYDLKTQELNDTFEAYSQDAQTMNAQLTVQFKVQPDKLLLINETYGTLDVLKERISSIAVEKAKVVLSKSSAMLIIENRSSLSNTVENLIKESVGQYYVDVTMVVVKDLAFNSAFENAVEQKMIAEQQKLQAQYDKETAIIKAEQELEVAKKAAEAELERAKASAQAQIEIANAAAEAIKIKSVEAARMLGFTINEAGEIDMTGKSAEEIKVISDYLKYIEYLSTWDGKLPEVVSDATAIYVPKP